MTCDESPRCFKCRYVSMLNGNTCYLFCAYLLIAGKRRGVPVDRCYRYVPKPFPQRRRTILAALRKADLREKAYAMRAEGRSITEIARALHIGTQTANGYTREYDRLHGPPVRPPTKQQQEAEEKRRRVARLHADGLSDRQIADETGWLLKSVRSMRLRMGLPPNKPKGGPEE